MIRFTQVGDYRKITTYFLRKKKLTNKQRAIIKEYADEGVRALVANTPVDTGVTAASWYYIIEEHPDSRISITFRNSNAPEGVPVVILLHYGHGTRNGGYVQGTNFINKSLEPIMQKIADSAWKEVIDT